MSASCATSAVAAAGFGATLLAALSGQDGRVRWAWVFMFAALTAANIAIAAANGQQVAPHPRRGYPACRRRVGNSVAAAAWPVAERSLARHYSDSDTQA